MADIGIGTSVSGSIDTPLLKFEIVFGEEFILDSDDGKIEQFTFIGYNGSFGPNDGLFQWMKDSLERNKIVPINTSASIYMVGVHNADNIAEDYCCEFISESTTATLKHGATWGGRLCAWGFST